jgi:hypothetical protein
MQERGCTAQDACAEEKGVLDIVGITGYYASLAMVMNATRMSMPPDGKRLSRFPD